MSGSSMSAWRRLRAAVSVAVAHACSAMRYWRYYRLYTTGMVNKGGEALAQKNYYRLTYKFIMISSPS